MENKLMTRRMAESAIFVAIATVLSIIKIDVPLGGGLTVLSMLPIILLSHRWGFKWGTLCAFAYSLIQLLLGLDNVSYAAKIGLGFVPVIIFLDYIIPYTALGLSSLAEKPLGKTRKAVIVGIIATFTFRFLCHYITGVWVWKAWMPEEYMGMPMTSPWLHSLLFNGWYMLAETVIHVIVVLMTYPQFSKYFRREDLANPA